MIKKSLIFFLFFGLVSTCSSSQNKETLIDINKTWEQFHLAFKTLDYEPMAKIHSKDLVRIAGGKRILDYTTYINNYKQRFEAAKQQNVTNEISLRFFERIHNDSIASERGIYKLIRNQNQDSEQTYYGQFHVLLKKEDGIWKIIMDYDSNEGNSIDEKTYLKAYDINDLDTFID